MFSMNENIFYGRHDLHKKYTVQKLKKSQQKHPVYEDKIDTRRKAIKVSGKLYDQYNFCKKFGLKIWFE